MKAALASNIRKLTWGAFLMETYLFISVFVPILSDVGLKMEEILWIEGIYALIMAALEIPAGYYADVYGRKRALILGSVCGLLGLCIFPFAQSFWAFVLGRVIMGIGRSFASGAREALIYDSLIELNEEQRYKEIYGNLSFNLRISAAVAGLLGGLLGQISMQLPLVLSIVPALLWLPVPFTLVEPKKHTMQLEHWSYLKLIFKESFVKDRGLRMLVLYTGFWGTWMYATYWLFQAYMEERQVPVLVFGILISAQNIIGGITGKYAKKLSLYVGKTGIFLLMPLLSVGTMLLAGLSTNTLASGLLLIIGALWGFSNVYTSDLIQQRVPSDRRATLLSTVSMIHRGSFFIAAPILGAINAAQGIEWTLVVTAIAYLFFASINILTLKRTGELDESPTRARRFS